MSMLLREIRFNSADDVYSLIEDLKKKHILHIKDDGSIASIDDEQFLVADNGNTYLLQDILALTDKEAESLGFQFLGKDHKKYSAGEIRSKTKSPLIKNQVLIDALLTIKMVQKAKEETKSQNLLNITFEEVCPITQENFIFPVIAPSGQNFEKYNINLWLLKNNINPVTRENLTKKDLIPNKALKDLIWVNFVQKQAHTEFLKKEIIHEKNQENIATYQTKINVFEKEKTTIVSALQEQIEVLQAEKEIIDSDRAKDKEYLKKASLDAFARFPHLKELDNDQLKSRQAIFQKASSSAQSKANIFRKLGVYKVESLAMWGVGVAIMIPLGFIFTPAIWVPIGLAAALTGYFVFRTARKRFEAKYNYELSVHKEELKCIDAVLKARDDKNLVEADLTSVLLNREIEDIHSHLQKINQIESEKSCNNPMPVEESKESFEGPISSSDYFLNKSTNNNTAVTLEADISEAKPSFKL